MEHGCIQETYKPKTKSLRVVRIRHVPVYVKKMGSKLRNKARKVFKLLGWGNSKNYFDNVLIKTVSEASARMIESAWLTMQFIQIN